MNKFSHISLNSTLRCFELRCARLRWDLMRKPHTLWSADEYVANGRIVTITCLTYLDSCRSGMVVHQICIDMHCTYMFLFYYVWNCQSCILIQRDVHTTKYVKYVVIECSHSRYLMRATSLHLLYFFRIRNNNLEQNPKLD